MDAITPRQRFIQALTFQQYKGLVPHFELVFYLTMEAFGRVHPLHRSFTQWRQMSEHERNLQCRDISDLYIKIAQKYHHSAILFHLSAMADDSFDETLRCLEIIRETSGQQYFLMIHGDATYSIPDGNYLVEFVNSLADNPARVKAEADKRIDQALERASNIPKGLLDGFALCSDYCLNTGPFLSPAMFDEFITPYLAKLIAGYRKMGFYTIKHTDGNIMPILDSLASANPHALHSLDPQGGVDIAKVKKLVGDKVCLIGNVNCALLDSGTDEQVIASARYALKHGMPNSGYIFSTSNCIYTGMNLKRYELILDIWQKEGIYS